LLTKWQFWPAIPSISDVSRTCYLRTGQLLQWL